MNFKLFRNIVAEDTSLLMEKFQIKMKFLLKDCQKLNLILKEGECDIHELARTDDFYIGLDENKSLI